MDAFDDAPVANKTLICSYAAWPGLIVFAFGSIFVAVGGYISINHDSIPFKSNGVYVGSTPIWFGLLFFGAGLSVVALAIYYFMVAKNENICVGSGTITWRGYDGKIKLVCSEDDVLPGTFSANTNGRGQVTGYELLTRKGRLKWSAQISYCSALVAMAQTLSSRPHPDTQQEDPDKEIFKCTYSVGPAIPALAVGMVILGVAALMAFTNDFGGSAMARAYSLPEALFGLLFFGSGLYGLVSAKNESIAVHLGHIIWTGPNGKTKLECAFKEVVPRSYETIKFNSGSIRSYKLRTAKGELKWGPRINSIQLLNELAYRLAGDDSSVQNTLKNF